VLVTLFVVGLVGLFAGRRTAKVPAAA